MKTQNEGEDKRNHTLERTGTSGSVLEVRQDRESHRCSLGRRFHELSRNTAQVVRPERLREERIGATTISTLTSLFLGMRGEDEDRELFSTRIGTKPR